MTTPRPQPKPDSRKYQDLISDIEKGVIKIPKFQREFVWPIEKTAALLDSIVKGYPIGTFILWKTNQRMADVKEVGSISLPPTPDDRQVEYVLDGQQRMTSLFAAYRGAKYLAAARRRSPISPRSTLTSTRRCQMMRRSSFMNCPKTRASVFR